MIVDVTAQPVIRSATASGDVVIPSVNVNDIPETGEDDDGEEAEPSVIGTTEEQTVSVSLPVSWTEDGQAVITFIFEFNDEMVLVHQPVETWHSGKHTILLYYPIEDVVANYTNTFKVYMRCSGGTGFVDTGWCVASISGQSMGASAAWDGRIEVEEYVTKPRISGGLKVHEFMAADTWEIDELVQRAYTDMFTGKRQIGAFAMPVDVEGSNE